MYMVPSIDAKTLTSVIEDTLTRMNMSLQNCRGQCYDGARNMSGAKREVAANITQKEPRAVYRHCYGHALNLAVGDTVCSCKILRDTMDTVHEVSKPIKYSPKRDVQFEELKSNINPETPRFRVLCPTRWTVRADCSKSVLDNYSVIQLRNDTETHARIVGVKSQMANFVFLIGVSLCYEILRHTDILSKTLQQRTMSASEGQDLAKLTVTTLQKLCSDDAYEDP